jgi:hypothetical protein
MMGASRAKPNDDVKSIIQHLHGPKQLSTTEPHENNKFSD